MVNCETGLFRFSPGWGLTYFSLVNALIYMDRSILGVTSIQGIMHYLTSSDDMDLTAGEAGLLGSVFILGYMVASPIMAVSAQHLHPLYLMGTGLLVWAGTAMMAGLAVNYPMLIVARALTGVGEASFVCLVPPYIVDVAPSTKKTVPLTQLWLSVFYASSIVGGAVGFVYGEMVALALGSWRWPYIIESLLMLPFLSLCFVAYKDPIFCPKKLESTVEATEKTSLWQQLSTLLNNRVFVLISLGYGSYAFTVGALTTWGPYYIHTFYHQSAFLAALLMGGITLLCGFSGTFIGAVFTDRRLRAAQHSQEQGEITAGDLLRKRTGTATAIMCICMGLAASAGLIGALVPLFPFYLCTLTIAELCIFLYLPDSQMGPIGLAIMSSVPNELRGQSNGVSVFIMHLLGDLPSPALVGQLITALGDYLAYAILAGWLFFGSLAWLLAWQCTVRGT